MIRKAGKDLKKSYQERMCCAAQESVSGGARYLDHSSIHVSQLESPMTRIVFLLFWHQNRTKKRREFPEVTGQDLKEQKRRNPGFEKDVCKHEKETA